ncbi:MAG: NlpC/P60 family protein [Acidimicrobiales bacterium]
MAGVVVVVGGLGLGGCGALVTGAALWPGGLGGGGAGAGSAPGAGPGVPAVPLPWEALDRGAAATCPGLPWPALAAVGRVESDSGRSAAPGVHSGANSAGAMGPLQFEPATFAAYAVTGPGGAIPPSPYDPVDAVYTAAALLCADGGGSPSTLPRAVWDYDHTARYVGTVLVLARALDTDPALGASAATALAFAAARLGDPYRWGGTGPTAYDCSGLVQAAYRAAGVALPRVTQAQYDAGPAVPPTTPPLPGDLLFFGSSPADVTHVGLYVGGGDMVDAPHTGAVVRVEPTPTVPGRQWGADRYLGATRPWQ